VTVDNGIVLRQPRPGDMGWVISQHGELYWREFGWDASFEALVAEIAAGMMRTHDPAWERGWIAERPGPDGGPSERLGCVFLVRKSDAEAQLRLLIVTPAARGLGLGARLTDACIAHARALGYRKLVLWTHSTLTQARRIYARRGFRLVRAEPAHTFGQAHDSEHWELDL